MQLRRLFIAAASLAIGCGSVTPPAPAIPQRHLVATSGGPDAGAELRAVSVKPLARSLRNDDWIEVLLDYRITQMRSDARYGIVPFFRAKNDATGGVTAVRDIASIVALRERSGQVVFKYPALIPLTDPTLARPAAMWLSVVEEERETAKRRVIVSIGPIAFQ